MNTLRKPSYYLLAFFFILSTQNTAFAQADAEKAWKKVRESNDLATLQQFIATYPNNNHSTELKLKVEELTKYNDARWVYSINGRGKETLEKYLLFSPKGKFVDNAKLQLKAKEELFWQYLSTTKTKGDIAVFLKKFPHSIHLKEATAFMTTATTNPALPIPKKATSKIRVEFENTTNVGELTFSLWNVSSNATVISKNTNHLLAKKVSNNKASVILLEEGIDDGFFIKDEDNSIFIPTHCDSIFRAEMREKDNDRKIDIFCGAKPYKIDIKPTEENQGTGTSIKNINTFNYNLVQEHLQDLGGTYQVIISDKHQKYQRSLGTIYIKDTTGQRWIMILSAVLLGLVSVFVYYSRAQKRKKDNTLLNHQDLYTNEDEEASTIDTSWKGKWKQFWTKKIK
ncbi:MAG: hypothetical protein RLZZ292_2726 [Bacteroidota bacterium]